MILGPDGEPFDPEYDLADDFGDADEGETVQILSVEAMREQLAHLVAQNRDAVRNHESQRLIDQATAACLEEGEIELGLSLGTLNALRVAGQQHMVCEGLLQLVVDLKQRTQLLERKCRVCGCTDARACPGGCSWVEFDLCSGCG